MDSKAACHTVLLDVATFWKAAHERLLTTRCHKLQFQSASSKRTWPELPIPCCWSLLDWIPPVTPFSDERKQAESKRTPRTQRLLRDIVHSSTKRSLRRSNSFSRQNISAVYMVPYSAERPRNWRFKSLAIETLERSWWSNALRSVWRWRHNPPLTPTFEFKQLPLWLTQCCSPSCKHIHSSAQLPRYIC